MATNQTNKLVWLVKTIQQAKKNHFRGTQSQMEGKCRIERR